ncbi:MAG: ankyrin repeat domain-containing protein [Candidatus Micrarchaeota archaeon]|nr:ankyrin repeat domain-containing protein [Candidatus Micrarchaeota archaeon]
MRIAILVIALGLVLLFGCVGQTETQKRGYATVDLLEAIYNNDTALAQSSIQKGADVNDRDNRGYTMLMTAAAWGRPYIAGLLIQNGADVNAINPYGDTALLQLHSGQDTNYNADVVRILIDNGANIDAMSNGGFTPLMYSANRGKTDAVKLLIEKGANVNVKNSYNYTALYYAKQGGYTEIINILKQAGAKE